MGSVGFFHRLNPSGRTLAQGSPQPLTEMSEGGGSVRLTTLPPSSANIPEIVGA